MTTENKSFPHLFHFSLQVICIAFWIYWLVHLPKSGKAVLLLGAMAALMMLVDMHPIHKAVYILLVFGLVWIENRALDRERAESAKETVERVQKENEKFQGCAILLSPFSPQDSVGEQLKYALLFAT